MADKVGQVQGEALLEAVSKGGDPKRGKIVMINGAPTDPNAADFKEGAHSVLDGNVDVGQEYDTPDWSPDKAQNEMEQAITAVGRDNIIGVYAANDGTAGGAIAAMKSAKSDRVYGGWWRRVVAVDGAGAVRRSADRYLRFALDDA